MALPYWPADVENRPVIGAITLESPYPEAVATEFEDGPPRMRRQARTGIRKLSYQLRLQGSYELSAFDAFVTTTLNNGVSHFTMPVFLPGRGVVSRRCYIDKGRWTASPVGGGVHHVSFTLCVFPT